MRIRRAVRAVVVAEAAVAACLALADITHAWWLMGAVERLAFLNFWLPATLVAGAAALLLWPRLERRSPAVLLIGGLAVPVVALVLLIVSSIVSSFVGVRVEGGRVGHSVTLLADGRVLVVGGEGDWGILASSYVFDPRTNAWTRASDLAEARSRHAALRLQDGRVLVAGGEIAGWCLMCRLPPHTASAEIFDPATMAWTNIQPMYAARLNPTARLLSDGRVRLSGGIDPMPGGSGQASEVYDPALRVWEQSPIEDRPPATPLVNVHAASDGTVFIRYGTTSQASKAPPPPAASHDPGRTDLVLRDGRALLAGGGSPSFPYDSPNRVFSDAAIYDPVRDQWTVVEPLRVARADAIAIELADGRVLVVGGRTIAGRLNSAELLDPRTGRWTSAGTLGPL